MFKQITVMSVTAFFPFVRTFKQTARAAGFSPRERLMENSSTHKMTYTPLCADTTAKSSLMYFIRKIESKIRVENLLKPCRELLGSISGHNETQRTKHSWFPNGKCVLLALWWRGEEPVVGWFMVRQSLQLLSHHFFSITGTGIGDLPFFSPSIS